MQPEKFQELFGVSRETFAKLEIYHALLLKWQKAINLVSGSTLNEAWTRHFADSAQLARFLPEGPHKLADLGSGAGFPGLVLAILRPDLEVRMVESDERKAQFMRGVSRETETPVHIHNARIEEVVPELLPDIVTARALASLEELFAHTQPWAARNPELTLLFLKGKNAGAETDQALKTYAFACEEYESLTSSEARILFIKRLQKRGNT